MENKYDVIVIGAGPGGMTASIYAARGGLKVAMIEKGAPGGQMVSTHEVENYTGFSKITGPNLSMEMFNHTQSQGVEYLYGNVQDIVDGKVKKVVCEDKTYEAKVVIIASGTVNRKLGVPNEDKYSSNGISWCAICDGAFHKGNEVAVIGGGNSAIEEAVYLSTICKKVTIIHRREDFRAHAIGLEKAREKDNIVFELNYNIVEFVGDDNLKGVKIKHKDTNEEKIINATGAFEYVGQEPNTSMCTNLDITNDRGYLVVNHNMETKIKGIYGVGDVNVKELRQIATAVSDGAIAAQAASKYIKTEM